MTEARPENQLTEPEGLPSGEISRIETIGIFALSRPGTDDNPECPGPQSGQPPISLLIISAAIPGCAETGRRTSRAKTILDMGKKTGLFHHYHFICKDRVLIQ
jgi:hypothetical protein